MPEWINTELLYAAIQGDTPTVRSLVEGGANLEAKNKYGYTALINAAYEGHTATVQYLLDKGASLEAKSNRGNTALDYAMQRSMDEVATILRDYPEAARRKAAEEARRKKAAEEAEKARKKQEAEEAEAAVASGE
eukprot:Hpha_TRINITY_DN16947_c2_g2::TRINITY_DN16947_c2_g2_i1::g.54819::m.54819